jgi:hypothetical protein
LPETPTVEITAAEPLVIEVVQPVTRVLEVSAPAGPQGLDGFVVADTLGELPSGLEVGTVWVKPV